MILEFRVEGKQLFGFDAATGVEHRINYCGNGEFSHYWLRGDQGSTRYVYEFDKRSELLKSIREAELRLVFGVKK